MVILKIHHEVISLTFYFIFVGALCAFSGCSTTYTIKHFTSKDTFYKDFNNGSKNNEIKVTLTNDSTFMAKEGAAILNDTLFTVVNSEVKESKKILLSEIDKIDYTGNDYKSASVLLKNGDDINVSDINIIPDSMGFIASKILTSRNNFPMDNVKTASYKNMLMGILPGSLIGSVAGGVIGFLHGRSVHDSHGNSQEIIGAIFGAGVGLAAGILIGNIFGYNYNYRFNQ